MTDLRAIADEGQSGAGILADAMEELGFPEWLTCRVRFEPDAPDKMTRAVERLAMFRMMLSWRNSSSGGAYRSVGARNGDKMSRSG